MIPNTIGNSACGVLAECRNPLRVLGGEIMVATSLHGKVLLLGSEVAYILQAVA